MKLAPHTNLPTARDAMRALMPYATDAQITIRARLLNLQRRSTTRAISAASDDAKDLFWLINREAAANVTAPAPCDDLRELTHALIRLAMAADTFERREARRG